MDCRAGQLKEPIVPCVQNQWGSVQGMCWPPAAIPLALTSVVEALSGAPSLSEAWLGTAQPFSPVVLGVCCVWLSPACLTDVSADD